MNAFQLNQISRLARMGLYGAGAALVCLGAFGAYRVLKKAKGTSTASDTNQEKTNEGRPQETGDTAAQPAEAATGADHGSDPEVARPVSEPQAQDQADLTPEEQFFEMVYNQAKLVQADPDWKKSTHAILTTKYKTSEPRKMIYNGERAVIFPLGPGLNVLLIGTEVHYFDQTNKKRLHTQLNIAEQNRPMEVTPENQATSYVYQKGMELDQVTKGIIHPAHAYQNDFEADRALPSNFLVKDYDGTKTIEFFNKVYDKAGKGSIYSYTRSDLAYIGAAINSAPSEEIIRFENFEGDKFMYLMDPEDPTKNMVLVLRQQGWVQIFVGEDTGVKTEGFDGWMEPAGKMFDVNNEEQLAQALLIDAAVVREVLGIEYTQGNEQAANGG